MRILTDNVVDFLYRVPDCNVDIYRPGSTAASALLYDARQHFDNQTVSSNLSREIVFSLPPKGFPLGFPARVPR